MNAIARRLKDGFILNDRYRIDELAGIQDIGYLYLCRDRASGRGRARLRIPYKDRLGFGDASSISGELSLLRRLQHPNLGRVLDFGIIDNSKDLFVVQEWVEGKDIYAGTEAMGFEELLGVLADIVRSLHYLHTRGLVHGCLNSSNIILSSNGRGRSPKLLDFGLVRYFPRLPLAGRPGNPVYMAPELLMGGAVTQSSDMYSLGILMYQLLTRRLPFEDADPGFLIEKHLQVNVDLRPIGRLNNGAILKEMLCGLLERDVSRRYESCESVLHPLMELIGREDARGGFKDLAHLFSASRFVGREKEQVLLKQRATRVQANGRGWTVFVAGEGGLGKSRLLEEFSSWARLEGWRIIEGACDTRHQESYGPYRQILAQTESMEGESIFRFDATPRVQELGAFESSSEFAAGQFRDLLTRELVRRLGACPTLLLLHDFHLSDDATSTVLDYLSSDIQTHPVLMCVSLRSGEGSKGVLNRVIEQALRQQRGEVLTLEPLDATGAGELVAGITGDNRLKDTLGSWLYSSIGGNPFFLEEMLKHLAEQGFLRYEVDRFRFRNRDLLKIEVPETIGAVLQRRLVQLTAASADLVNWLALFHRPVARDLLRSILAWSDDDLAQALQELEDRQLIRTGICDSAEVIELCHALIAEVVRGNLSKARLRRMHRKIAEVLEQEFGADVNLQELATHSMEGRTGAKSVRYALQLATQSHSEFAHEKALQCYEYVFSNRGDLTESELCEAAIEASNTMFALGQPKMAIFILKRAMKRCREIKKELKARILMQFAVAYKHLGDISRKDAFCKKGLQYLRFLRVQKDPTKALFWAELAFSEMLRSNPRLGLKLLGKAIALCPDPNSGILAGRIQNLEASLHRVACDFRKALVASEKAVSILSKCERSYLTCSAYSTLGLVLMGLGRFSLALKAHQKAVDESEKNRDVALRAQASANLIECLCKMGCMKEALETAEDASEYICELQNPAIRDAFEVILAEIKLNLCDYVGAMELVHQLEKKEPGSSAHYILGHAHYIGANLHFIMGDFEHALENIGTLFAFQIADAPFYERELAAALKARILFERGLHSQAIDQLRSLDRAVTKKRWPYQMCLIKLHLAELMLKEGLLGSAKKMSMNALRLANGMHSAYLIGQSHFVLGSVYSAFPRFDNNESYIDSAINSFQQVCKLGSYIPNEIVLRAHASLSLLFEKMADTKRSLDHAEIAYDFLFKIESRLPLKMLNCYKDAFKRNAIKSELLRIIGRQENEKSINENGRVDIRNDDSRIFLQVSAAANSIMDIDRLIEGILDQLMQAVKVERAFVYLLSESSGKLCLAKGRNNLRENIRDLELTHRAIVDEVFGNEMPVISSNALTDPRFINMRNSSEYPGLLLCAPLRVSDRILGVLYADHSLSADNLNESVINLFAGFCNLAAIAIDNAIAHRQLALEKSELEQYLHQARDEYPEIVGKSAMIDALRDRIGLAAKSPLDILIIGESGTGKELVARAIHRSGKRQNGRFIAVDCGSLTDNLAEAELFGYRKGAFTGAFESRAGLLESAHEGILFLDEISNLPLRIQTKFLRVLQEREVRRIGETITRKVDFQVLSATNRDILQDIREEKFRPDLYHRIRRMEIHVPPLRERSGDIPLLLEWYLAETAKIGGQIKKFAPDAKEILHKYNYPGNIRELKNIVEESYYSAQGSQITVDSLPSNVRGIEIDAFSVESSMAARIFLQIRGGQGTFDELIKQPFLDRQLSPPVLRGIIEKALKESSGSYRRAFAMLKIPERQYSLTIRFLKRYKCYLNYQFFRRRQYE